MKYRFHFVKQIGLLIKKNHVILLSFFLPMIILEIAYAAHGIFPFGNRSLLIIDLYHQYAPFVSDLQDKFRSFSSLFYSWTGGLGISFLPLFAYYLASPLNFITVLFPKEYLSEAILVLTLLKIGLAGVCFSIYLNGIHREKNLVTAAFSLLYALSGYVLIFSWNIMWMDAIYLLPLIMLGLVRLIRDGRGFLFSIALAVTLISNFYISFFVCFFILLYYPVCLFQYHSFKKPSLLIKRTLEFAEFSLLSAGLSAIILLPTYIALKSTSAANNLFPKTIEHYFDFFDFISRHFTAATPSIREGMPNLYCGIIILILLPIYFFSKSIKLKEKFLHIALLMILIISFNINTLNFIWHGLHFPNQIPYRFSFVYIFLVLSIAYAAFKRINEFTGKQIGAICASILALVLISQKFDDLKLDYFTFYASVISIILYAAALTIDRSNNIRHSHRFLMILLVIIVEMTANTNITIYNIDINEGYSSRDGYSSGKEAAQIRSRIASINAEDKSFFRLEIVPPKTTNDPFLYNYRGLSYFSSTAPKQPVRMLENLGYHSNSINSCGYEGSTAVLDSFFGIKYLIYRSMNIEERLYKKIAQTDELTVFMNPYALPLGFQAPKEMEKFYSSSSNPFDVQNNLIKEICGVKDILFPIGQKQGAHYNLAINSSDTRYYSFTRTNKENSSTAKIKVLVEKDQQVYLYYKAPYNMKGSGFVTLNDKKIDFNPRHSTIINLGFCKSGTTPELQIDFNKESPESGRFEVYASSLDVQALENAINLIRQKSMTVESYTNTSIRGSAEASDTGLMIMTVPYDKGWHVRVDGREVKTLAIDNCLLSFELEKGKHEIELRFLPEKFLMGLIITTVSILLLVILFVKKRKPQPSDL